MLIKYTFTFKTNHLKYFNSGIWTFLFKLQEEFDQKLKLTSIIRLPKKKLKLTIMKSPHVYKAAREQYQIETNTLKIAVIFKLKEKRMLKLLNNMILNNVIKNKVQRLNIIKIRKRLFKDSNLI